MKLDVKNFPHVLAATRGKRVWIGLSGGVDSAVTAALLKRAGAAVTGVFIKGWYPPGLSCSWAKERQDAMRVAASLLLPFSTLDASKEYKQGVIDYLLAEYKLGRTPNPDVMCNREVKFGAFARYAKEKGADAIATGHYARVEGGKLLRGVDASKDQSYFLWAVPKEILSFSLFPLGAMHKTDVRREAARMRLPVATKSDSQGICFLGSVSVHDFLQSEFETEPGPAVDEVGKNVGIHDGVLLHTLGARIALQNAKPGPWYVLAKDLTTNTLTVSNKRALQEVTPHLTLREVHNLNLNSDQEVSAQFRYHGPLIPGTFALSSSRFIPAIPF
ncbi:MAG: tRNA 2-thiouridine(34) synthase MnmA, partial [Minisyncoccia bacterium]